ESAQMIPDCMTSRVDTKQNKGPYKDIWDGEWDVMGIFETLRIPSWLRNGLAVIVGLLSLEWLIRKLLRLAWARPASRPRMNCAVRGARAVSRGVCLQPRRGGRV